MFLVGRVNYIKHNTMDYTATLHQIAEEMGFAELEETQKAELVAKMGEALLKRILMETFDRLGETGMAEYDALIDRDAQEEEITAFLNAKIPNYEKMVAKIVEEFKETMKQQAF